MTRNIFKRTFAFTAIGLLAACSDGTFGGNPPATIEVVPGSAAPPPQPIATFQVTVSNLTNGQPMSPAAVIVHQPLFKVFELGAPATVELEVLAEGGNNADLLRLADDNPNVFTTASGNGPIPPGQSDVISFEIEEQFISSAYFSVSTMLVNTNDAITGVNTVDMAGLEVGDSLTRRGVAYDAGTEADDELAIYIPGPAGGGEGFNSERDDQVNGVTMHTGVVTQHDGLVTSALNGQHKFDNPTVQVRIERIE